MILGGSQNNQKDQTTRWGGRGGEPRTQAADLSWEDITEHRRYTFHLQSHLMKLMLPLKTGWGQLLPQGVLVALAS